jgi:TPR repeat protein
LLTYSALGAEDYSAACDGYALNRYDLDAPAGAGGVRFENVPGSNEAIKACAKAIEVAPQERRYVAQLARIELRAGKFDRALADYRRAAEAGSAMAMFSVGFMLENGCGTVEDHTAAVDQYKAAAALGQTSAMVNLAFANHTSWSSNARKMLEDASAAGNADAMARRADLYLSGVRYRGLDNNAEPDTEKAFEWYRKAYEGGSARSWWPLFLFYYHEIKINRGGGSESRRGRAHCDCRKFTFVCPAHDGEPGQPSHGGRSLYPELIKGAGLSARLVRRGLRPRDGDSLAETRKRHFEEGGGLWRYVSIWRGLKGRRGRPRDPGSGGSGSEVDRSRASSFRLRWCSS